MSTDDDLRTGLRSLLDPFVSKVIPPQRNRKPTTMAMVLRYDPTWIPTATTLKGRERQAGKRLVEIYAEREAELTSPPSDSRNKLLIHRLKSAKPSKIKDA